MKKVFKIIVASVTVICLFVVATCFFGFKSLAAEAKPDVEQLPTDGASTTILAANGNEIYRSKRYVALSEIPDSLINAIVAVEDKRFFEHSGVDYKRICGAMLKNVKAKRIVEGASTITQQLIKNTELTSEKTLSRKINEIALAKKLETLYDKQQILEMYLNVIYLGGGCYGVAAAADYYFGKDVSNLSLSESATIAGITKNPSKYNPKTNPESSKNRRNLILKLMTEQGYISENDCEIATNTAIKTIDSSKKSEETYVFEAIFEAAKIVGMSPKKFLQSGFTVQTYFDAAALAAADNAIIFRNNSESVIMVSDNETCGIIALASSSKAEVRNLKRQIASTAKPILVYAPSINEGIVELCSPVIDEPTDFYGYSPKNYHDRYYGLQTVKQAISKSLNVPAVKTLNDLGVKTAVSYGKKMGLSLTESDQNLGLALGGLTNGISFLELSGAYMTLANGGEYARPTYISKIMKGEKVIYSHDLTKTAVFSPQTAYLVGIALEEAATVGTAKTLADLNFPVYAKTGTNSVNGKNIDAYSVAYTLKHTALCWRGNADNTPLQNDDTGGAYATKSIKTLFENLYSSFTPTAISKPTNVLKTAFDKSDFEDGLLTLASPYTPKGYYFEEYVSGLKPFEPSKNFINPTIKDLVSIVSGDNVNVEFMANAPYFYEIYSADVFGSTQTIFLFEGDNTKQNVSFSVGFLKNYYIKCGFIDYFGNVRYGEPQKLVGYFAPNIFS